MSSAEEAFASSTVFFLEALAIELRVALRLCPSQVVTRVDLSRGRVVLLDGDEVVASILDVRQATVERLDAVVDVRLALRDRAGLLDVREDLFSLGHDVDRFP